MGRILALDYGNKKIGVAISDPMKIIAKPLQVIMNSSYKRVLNEINNLIKELDIEMILVGLPITMKNTSSEQTQKLLNLLIN